MDKLPAEWQPYVDRLEADIEKFVELGNEVCTVFFGTTDNMDASIGALEKFLEKYNDN